MAERVIERIENAESSERVLIVLRADGVYCYRKQIRSGEDQHRDIWPEGYEPEAGWSPPGPHCGLYDSPATAKYEALCRVDWLQSTQPAN